MCMIWPFAVTQQQMWLLVSEWLATLAISSVQRKFSWAFILWHMVVICIWCVLFVTAQFDVIFMFPNQHFGEVC